MDFMRDGGLFMWVILLVALVALGVSIARRDRNGWVVAVHGAVGCLGLGLLGFSLGLNNTFKALEQFAPTDPDKLTIMTIGIRESANNTLFGGGLAVLLCLLAVFLARPAAASTREAALGTASSR